MSTLTSFIFLLLILWVLGYFAFHIAGALIHVLLVVAIIMILVRIIQGKNPLR